MIRAFALAIGIALTATAHADVSRFALVIGENHGDAADVTLHYAETDGQHIGDVLVAVGNFHPEDVVVMKATTAGDVRRALIAMNTRIRQVSGESLLFVFYSGHADTDSVHLAGTRLPMSELRGLVAGSSATARILVVDACRSGVLTRVKGGHAAPSFDIHVDAPLQAQGFAILTSSAAGEDSQESDGIGASFFTHYLVSALRGAADGDRDGKVTLAEAFDYASERTLSATAATVAGPQHPTYLTDMGGRENLVLAQPGLAQGKLGILEFATPGSYLVRGGGSDGAVVAELFADKPTGRLALDPGRYTVSQREPDYLAQGEFTIAAGATTEVRVDALHRIDYARVVRKGGTRRTRALSVFVVGGARGEILGLGAATAGVLGVRVDLAPISLEVRAGIARSVADDHAQTGELVSATSLEPTLSLAALRAFDLGPITVGGGVELGASWLTESFDRSNSPARTSYGGFIGPLVQVDVPIWSRAYLRVESTLLTYLRGGDAGAQGMTTSDPVTFRVVAGFGLYY